MSARVEWRRTALLTGLAACLGALCVVQLSSFDVWWHLATGRWIVEKGAIPREDPFSYTRSGAPWRYVSWTADLALYGLWRLGGAGALCLAKGALAGITFALCALSANAALAGAAIRRAPPGADPSDGAARAGSPAGGDASRVVAVLGAVACAAVFAQPRLALARPLLFGAVLLGAALWVANVAERRPQALIAFPPLVALWLPTHGGAVVGIALGIGACVAVALRARDVRTRVLAGGCALATLALLALLPAGRDTLHVIGALGADSPIVRLTTEWAPTSLSSSATWAPLAFLALATGGALGEARQWRSGGALAPLGCVVVAWGVGLRFERNLAEAALLATPGAALALAWLAAGASRRVARAADGEARTAQAEQTVGSGGRRVGDWLGVALCVALVAAHVSVAPRGGLRGPWGLGVWSENAPEDALAALRRLPEGRVINDLVSGGYLIWHEVPVYVDGRSVALYDDAAVESLIVGPMRDPALLSAQVATWSPRYAFVRPDSALGQAVMTSTAWTPVFHGASTSVFVHRGDGAALAASGLAPLHEVRWVPHTPWVHDWYESVCASEAGRAALARAWSAMGAAREGSRVGVGAGPSVRSRCGIVPRD